MNAKHSGGECGGQHNRDGSGDTSSKGVNQKAAGIGAEARTGQAVIMGKPIQTPRPTKSPVAMHEQAVRGVQTSHKARHGRQRDAREVGWRGETEAIHDIARKQHVSSAPTGTIQNRERERHVRGWIVGTRRRTAAVKGRTSAQTIDRPFYLTLRSKQHKGPTMPPTYRASA